MATGVGSRMLIWARWWIEGHSISEAEGCGAQGCAGTYGRLRGALQWLNSTTVVQLRRGAVGQADAVMIAVGIRSIG